MSDPHPRRAPLALFALITLVCACSTAPAPHPVAPEVASEAAPVASGEPGLVQPSLMWGDGSHHMAGTAFFVAGPGGQTLAVTSAHYLDRHGPPLTGIEWFTIPTWEPRTASLRFWGEPGTGAEIERDVNLFPVLGEVAPSQHWTLDPRGWPEAGERVWLANKADDVAEGYHRVTGTVTARDETSFSVTLDASIVLQSQSGSPIVSQDTGQVVGIVTNGIGDVIGSTPTASVLAAIEAAEFTAPLSAYTGLGYFQDAWLPEDVAGYDVMSQRQRDWAGLPEGWSWIEVTDLGLRVAMPEATVEVDPAEHSRRWVWSQLFNGYNVRMLIGPFEGDVRTVQVGLFQGIIDNMGRNDLESASYRATTWNGSVATDVTACDPVKCTLARVLVWRGQYVTLVHTFEVDGEPLENIAVFFQSLEVVEPLDDK